jgi:2-phosphosulfolactate phosphatase
MKIFVYYTPAQVPSLIGSSAGNPQPDCAVAVDVLRATTSIATALAGGAEAIEVFADLEALEQASGKYPSDHILKAAERGGSKVSGYDLGNSPFEYTPAVVKGKRIFMSTTNGTKALQKIQEAPHVVTCALINLKAVAEFIDQTLPNNLWIACSGWENSFSLEDTACAGALIDLLDNNHKITWGNDEAIGALALYRQWQNNLEDLLNLASHGQRLCKLGASADLTYCATRNTHSIVPRQIAPGVIGL